jgi:hypothetical protein
MCLFILRFQQILRLEAKMLLWFLHRWFQRILGLEAQVLLLLLLLLPNYIHYQ